MPTDFEFSEFSEAWWRDYWCESKWSIAQTLSGKCQVPCGGLACRAQWIAIWNQAINCFSHDLSETWLFEIAGSTKRRMIWDHAFLCFNCYHPTKWCLTQTASVQVTLSFCGDLIQMPHREAHHWELKISSAGERTPSFSSSTLGYYYNFNDLPQLFYILNSVWRKDRKHIGTH